MKIGIDIRCLLEPQYSGISEYTYNLIKGLLKVDRINQYILFYNSYRPVSPPKFEQANVSYQSFSYPNKIFNLSIRFLNLVKIDSLIGDVDIFITPSFLFTNLSNNCRKILIVHDLSFELYPEFFTLKKRLWHKLIGPKQLCQKADLIIAISENTKQDIIRLYQIPPEKIKVISPGINDLFFAPITDEAKERVKVKYNLPPDYIFYLGNLEPRKNVDALISALNKVKNESIKLVIGGGQAWKYKKIYRRFQESPIKQRIKFLGYVDEIDKPALYALAKIFVYPSIYEGFGLPPLEAMACGTPVIAGANSSLTEALGQTGLLIDQNNINDLAAAIDELLRDKELYSNLVEAGKNQAGKFRWRDVAQRINPILNK